MATSFTQNTKDIFECNFFKCNGIQTPDPVKALDFQKHCVPKTFDYFACQNQVTSS